MSIPCKFESSLLNHDEFEVVRITHYPAINDLDGDQLEESRRRLREMRDKERTFARQKRRESRGKAEARGGSFPGTAERPWQRKQVFVSALKRINREVDRQRRLDARKARAASGFHHLNATDNARHGMRPVPSRRRATSVSPGRIGSVSQATKAAQAKRDSKS